MQRSLRVGSPVLRVRNIDSVLKFYERSLGLHVIKIHQNHDQADGSNDNLVYELGFNQDLLSYESILKLHHDPNAKNTSLHSAGLYHFAIVVPDRRNLACT
jgi:catechol-2,3-dioxygenase